MKRLLKICGSLSVWIEISWLPEGDFHFSALPEAKVSEWLSKKVVDYSGNEDDLKISILATRLDLDILPTLRFNAHPKLASGDELLIVVYHRPGDGSFTREQIKAAKFEYYLLKVK